VLQLVSGGGGVGRAPGILGRSVHFRMLHVFDFRDGKISRENVWLDGGSISHQLSN